MKALENGFDIRTPDKEYRKKQEEQFMVKETDEEEKFYLDQMKGDRVGYCDGFVDRNRSLFRLFNHVRDEQFVPEVRWYTKYCLTHKFRYRHQSVESVAESTFRIYTWTQHLRRFVRGIDDVYPGIVNFARIF